MSADGGRRAEHLNRWGELLSERMNRLRWSREEIVAEQRTALRRLVVTARKRSAWHGARLAGLDVASLEPDDLTVLPTMTKADLMGNFDDIVTDRRVTRAAAESHLAVLHEDRYFLDDLHAVASGGSSGERAIFVYGWDAWVDVHQGLSRRVAADIRSSAAGAPAAARMGVIAAANATHMTTAVASTFASPMLEIHPFPVTLPFDDIVAGLNRTQPTMLAAYASVLGVLAAEAGAGRLRIAPGRLIAMSEPLLPEVRVAAEDAFGASVANFYGTSEGGGVAMGCWQSDGMHLNEDLVIIEPVDADGRPVPPGTRSDKVFLTNLFNPLQPLIRYELTDEVVMLDDPCPCGSAYRRVADVQGRHDDLFVYGDVTIHPHVLRSALAKHPLIVEYQVQQTTVGIDVDVVAPTDEHLDINGVGRDLAAALRGAGLPNPTVTIQRPPTLTRHRATGKLRRFVPLMSEDHARMPGAARESTA